MAIASHIDCFQQNKIYNCQADELSSFPVSLHEIWEETGFDSFARARLFVRRNYRLNIDYQTSMHEVRFAYGKRHNRQRLYHLTFECAKRLADRSTSLQAHTLRERLEAAQLMENGSTIASAIYEARTCRKTLADILKNLSDPLCNIAFVLRLLEQRDRPTVAARSDTYYDILAAESRKLLDLFHEVRRLHDMLSEDHLSFLRSHTNISGSSK